MRVRVSKAFPIAALRAQHPGSSVPITAAVRHESNKKGFWSSALCWVTSYSIGTRGSVISKCLTKLSLWQCATERLFIERKVHGAAPHTHSVLHGTGHFHLSRSLLEYQLMLPTIKSTLPLFYCAGRKILVTTTELKVRRKLSGSKYHTKYERNVWKLKMADRDIIEYLHRLNGLKWSCTECWANTFNT